MLKPFSGEKIQSRRNGAQKWRFFGKIGVETLDFVFSTPKKHFLARNRVKIGSRVSAVAFFKNKKIGESL